MCGVTHITVVSLMYIPIEVPKSSKLHRRPVRSPLLEGRARKDKRKVIHQTCTVDGLLTFKEWCILIGIDVDLLEFADSDLFRKGELQSGLWVVPVAVSAHRVGFELFLTESNAERNREVLVSIFREQELFW